MATKKKKATHARRYRKPVKWPFWLLLMTLFQLSCMLQIYINGTQESMVYGIRRIHCGGMDLLFCVRHRAAAKEL